MSRLKEPVTDKQLKRALKYLKAIRLHALNAFDFELLEVAEVCVDTCMRLGNGTPDS